MKTLLLISTLLLSFNGLANYEGYDEIVSKLSKYQTKEELNNQAYQSPIRSFSRAHVGLGLAQTFYDADAVALNSRMQNQSGLLINIGVDVLNPQWGVEGSYSNFGSHSTSNSKIKLREFSLKGLYKPTLTKNWSMRVGLGVSSRFLSVNNPQTNESYKTPSGLFLIGMDTYINSFVSVGADLNFKTAMIHETIDKNSVDLAFRIDTHF